MRRSNTFWSFLLFSAVLLSSTRSQTDDADQLEEAYEEARKKIEELTQSLNLSELKVLQLNKTLEANKQQGSPTCRSNIGPETQCFNNERFGCYCLVGVDLLVTEAARFCQSHAMRLVSIESPAEEQYLAQIIEAAKFGKKWEKWEFTYWWTSGSDVEVENKWVWTATGQPVQYTNWAPEEPNNVKGNEHYIGIRVESRTVKWFDFPNWKWTVIYAICEY